jgi:organic radical activating enzyme
MNDKIVNWWLDIIRQRAVTIEVFVTRKCSFHCNYCMYDCGPKESNDYITDEMLYKIKRQCDFLVSKGVKVVINLTGGEPTINFNKFEHILEIVSSWDVDMMLTTNAWWLNSKKNTYRFFEVVSKYAHCSGQSNYYRFEHGLLIRLTNDPEHDKERGIVLEEVYNNLFDDFDMVEKYNIPIPAKEHPWIFYFPYDERYFISPNGRGKSIADTDIKFCHRDINEIPSIHYELNGKISDICGFGSLYDFGTVEDNIIVIMIIIRIYQTQRYNNRESKPYSCWNCREDVKEWKDTNLFQWREALKEYNNFDW